jgi:hypothetical protein
MTITVQIRNVYGNETIYPACDRSRAFAEIAGTKTLTRHVINQIKALGYSIAVQQAQVSL